MSRYLPTHAEPEARDPIPEAEGSFGHVVVVPACGEDEGLDALLDSVPPGPLGTVLVMVVVNARDDHDGAVHAANARTLARLAARAAAGEPPHRRLRLIDRASPGRRLPAKQGVGLARKIGHDVALALHLQGRIRSRYQQATDADALLPVDLFERVAAYETGPAPPAALVYPWSHRADPDPGAGAAIRLYEVWLRYHHLGLIHAGSPYAYWSIGSTIAVRSEAYAVVRGFPRTMAGEDFYLLDKLAKSGWIDRLAGVPITLAGRPSDRVPFGTGRAVRTIDAAGWNRGTYPVLHPRGYVALGAWLSVLESPPEERPATAARLAATVAASAAAAGLGAAEGGSLVTALRAMGALEAAADSLTLRLSPENRRRRLHTHFDAFRTLKLLHALRDDAFPALPLREALREAPFLAELSSAADDATREAGLEMLEAARGRGATGLVIPPRTPGSSRR